MKTKILTLLALAIFGLSTANAQVGIGTTNPDNSAALDVDSNEKGFLPPRMDTNQRDGINGGTIAQGLVIYNTDVNCLQWYDGTDWFDPCEPPEAPTVAPPPTEGGNFTNGFEQNTTCTTSLISVTPCSFVSGATQSSQQPHTNGTLYDWPEASNATLGVGFGAPSATEALVEIGGQCWAKFNMNIATTDSYCYNNTSANCATDGRLYEWAAAMNASTDERDQGVCPEGWHIPSDCEWMYLENTLGMDVTEQDIIALRSTGDVGSQLSSDTFNGDNSSGFTGLLAGRRRVNGAFTGRNSLAHFWTSTNIATTTATYRRLNVSQTGVRRGNLNRGNAMSVRCLKD